MATCSAEGVRNAASIIGQGAEEFAIHVKGLEGPAHDPRSGKALAITYATANRGMCHIHPLEGMAWDRGKIDWGMRNMASPIPMAWSAGMRGEGRRGGRASERSGTSGVLGTCKFYMYGGVTVDHWAEMVTALTGWDIDGPELLKISERVLNLQRMFNVREGITRKDDQVPARVRAVPSLGKYATEPAVKCGTWTECLMSTTWSTVGIRRRGIPTQKKLEELGLG